MGVVDIEAVEEEVGVVMAVGVVSGVVDVVEGEETGEVGVVVRIDTGTTGTIEGTTLTDKTSTKLVKQIPTSFNGILILIIMIM
jgi:hypothetical protein